MNFTQLHQQKPPLLIANVWDASSAAAAKQAGYQALGTSSAAIATMFGYEDGETMTFDELFYIVSRIISATNLPLSVDIEAGFAQTASEVSHHIKRLIDIGVVGINIEDSKVTAGTRVLRDSAVFDAFLVGIRTIISKENQSLFINVRTDTYLLKHQQALQETLRRGELYRQAGIDGLFVPCLTAEHDIAALCQQIDLPLNLMCMPELTTFDRLEQLGVKRISMGNFVHASLQATLENRLTMIRSQQSFSGVFN